MGGRRRPRRQARPLQIAASLLAALCLGLAGAAAGFAQDDAAEARARARTLDEQGPGSHASGQRPELGAVLRSRLLAQDARIIRVGLTPTAFAADGSVRLEYDTALAHNHERVEIGASARFEVVEIGSGATLSAFDPGETVSFVRAGSGIAVGAGGRSLGLFPGPLRARTDADAVLVVHSIRRLNRLQPPVDGSFPLTPAPYRGELEVRASEADPARLRLVDVVAIEPYVAGVVVNESLSSFHVEALRAQAVAARGYALANVGRFASRGFDVDDSTLSQVYRGQSSETQAALAASAGTEGLVALAEGRILSALYSSSMGGHTEDNEWIFPAGGLPGTNGDPALRAIHDVEAPLAYDLASDDGVLSFYTSLSPAAYEVNPVTGQPLTSLHRWTRTRSAGELLARLKDTSRQWQVPAAASRIDDLRVTLRGRSGRAMQVVVRGDWGETTISGWSDLRALATLAGVTPGGTALASAPNSPSTSAITRDAAGAVASVTFYGGGFGHNVGMSQYGAQGRALRGHDFAQILSGYYSGVRLGSVPVLVSAGSAFEGRARLAGHPTLIVENAGLAALRLQIDGRSLELPLRRNEQQAVDLTGYVAAPASRWRLAGLGEGVAVARIELDPPRRAQPRR